MIEQWVKKLRLRFGEAASSCGLSTDGTTSIQDACSKTDVQELINALDEARYIFSAHHPKIEIVPFSLNAGNFGIQLKEEPMAVLAVHGTNNSFGGGKYFAIEHGSQELANYYADPEWLGENNLLPVYDDAALSRVYDVHRDYASNSIDYEIVGKQIRILSRVSWPFVGEVQIAAIRTWDDVPRWAEPTVMKLALVYLIDSFTVSSQGLLRIPVPNGYVEFDSGRVMQNLRTKLETEAMKAIEVKTGGLLQG